MQENNNLTNQTTALIEQLETISQALINLKTCDTLNDVDNVLQQVENMKKKQIFEQHKYPITYGKNDNRWHTYVPDTTRPNNRKSVAKRYYDDLVSYLVDFYTGKEKEKENKLITLESFYPTWLEHKSLDTTQMSYIVRINNDWKKYYIDDPIIKIPLQKLTSAYLYDWCHRIVKEKQLTKTQYYNMSVILRQSLQYAFDCKLIPENPFAMVKVNKKLFFVKGKPEDEKEVFLYSEQERLEKEAYAEFERSECSFALAIPLAFQLGTRVGECVSLKFSDLDEMQDNYIHIQRMEVDDYILDKDNHFISNGQKIVDKTKTAAGNRNIYLTPKARDIIHTIYNFNKEHNLPTDGYVFVNKKGNAHRYNLDYRLRKCCRAIDILPRSNHKIRKSFVSSLIDSGEVNIKTIMQMAGHASAKTTYENYCFNRKGKSETQTAIEKALAIKKCNQV